jgi:hypothetical protein
MQSIDRCPDVCTGIRLAISGYWERKSYGDEFFYSISVVGIFRYRGHADVYAWAEAVGKEFVMNLWRSRIACVGLLMYASCANPHLIANSKLDQGRIHDTVKRVSDASGLKVNHPLSVTLVNRAELHQVFRESEATRVQSSVWSSRQSGYRAMGFLPGEAMDPGTDAALWARSAAGFYIGKQQTLYVIGDHARSEKGGFYLNSLGDFGHEMTLAHEIVHALQHQHFPEFFETDENAWLQQADANMAVHAAIEGDANLWAARSIGLLGRARDPDEVIEMARDSKFEPLSDAPILIRERIQFPYTYGYRFAYSEGKASLKDPPASTEQIIHVGGWSRRAFLAVDLSSVGTFLETKGCHVLFQDTMGEFILSLWLRSLDSATGQNAWEGWDGDRWIAVECDQSQEMFWFTSWDTEQDAREFEAAVGAVAAEWQRRANLKSTVVTERQGREVLLTTSWLRPEIRQMKQLAKSARVKTRAELSAHFAGAK